MENIELTETGEKQQSTSLTLNLKIRNTICLFKLKLEVTTTTKKSEQMFPKSFFRRLAD
jgi:hypothetical protein